MGTHPIFESDFDCLTEMSQNRTRDWVNKQYWSTPQKYVNNVPANLPRSSKRPRKLLLSDSSEDGSDEITLGQSLRNEPNITKSSQDSSPPTTDGEEEDIFGFSGISTRSNTKKSETINNR